MSTYHFHLLLADDDKDDCLFFKEALEQLPYSTELKEFHFGDQLMQWLTGTEGLPDALFLDLNMPRKNGFQCLSEIKNHEKLKALPVIILTTSYEKEIADRLYAGGASFYIRKPPVLSALIKALDEALTFIAKHTLSQPDKEKFVLTGNLNKR
ncbi:response regulator [Pseudoflavitalea sp. G-6-1-2]|uniref:response regulator n=1 Tax=Pseudoflavitalea sp. G-6-1-2 TaxID=2728841 RepID=UPI00146DB2F2|nr:response regulator [Pseudoflavitalea sp. G-6-1-2]NML22452.1 response regulator [Pseudoflavitalea sp. G-6-1-2]